MSDQNVPVTADSNVQIDCDNDSSSTTDIIQFTHDNGTELMRIQEDGNVGIGETSPGEKLEIAGNLRLQEVTSDPSADGDKATIFARRLNGISGMALYARLNGQTLNRNLGALDWVNVMDFGATGLGSTDDSAAIQAAIDSLSEEGGTVFFPKGIYKIETGLKIYSGIQLIGGSAGTWDGGGASYIMVNGTTGNIDAISTDFPYITANPSSIEPEGSNLTANASSGQKNVTVADGSIFSVDDEITLKDDTNSEQNTIDIIAGNVLTMKNDLANTYTTANNGIVFKQFKVNYPASTDLSEVQAGWVYWDGVGAGKEWNIASKDDPNDYIICDLDGGAMPSADNDAEIYRAHSFQNIVIKNLHFYKHNNDSNTHTALKLFGTVEMLLENLKINGFDVGIKIDQWVNTISKCTVNHCRIGIDLRSEAYFMACNATTLYGVHILNCCEYGIRIRGVTNALIGCTVEGCHANLNEVSISSVTGSGPWTVALSGSPDLSGVQKNDTFMDESGDGSNPGHLYRITAIDDGADELTVDDFYNEGTAPSTGSGQAFTRKDAVGICIEKPDTWQYAASQENCVTNCYTERNDVTLEIGGDSNKIIGNRLNVWGNGTEDNPWPTACWRWLPDIDNTDYSNTGNCFFGNSYFLPGASSDSYGDFFEGNVGIGTTSPGDLLTVQKDQNSYTDIKVRNDDTTDLNSRARFVVGDSIDRGHLEYIYNWYAKGNSVLVTSAADYLGMWMDGAHSIGFWTDSTERLVINSDGNVGIGTTSPGRLLQVGRATGDNIDGIIRIAHKSNGNSREWDIGTGDSSLGGHNDNFFIRDHTGSQTIMMLEKSANGGSVGIGTTSPHYKLTVDGAIAGLERTSDPAEPNEGEFIIWMSDGSGKGDDGDVLIASKAGGTTKWTTLFDHSAGSSW